MTDQLAHIKESVEIGHGYGKSDMVCLIGEVERLTRIDRVTAEALASSRAEIERLKAANSDASTKNDLLRLGARTSTQFADGMERAAVIAEATVDTRDFHPGFDKQRLGWNNCRRAIMFAIRAEIKK